VARRVQEVTPDVVLARATDFNLYLIRDGHAVTLIDSGYLGDPGPGRGVVAVAGIGRRPEDICALLLLTHAHVDHIGAANRLHIRFGTPVYTDPIEVRHAHRARESPPGGLVGRHQPAVSLRGRTRSRIGVAEP
jgi:glyoxylase-like metal-dependent hydrolase (beta-lactamase superfamily II)